MNPKNFLLSLCVFLGLSFFASCKKDNIGKHSSMGQNADVGRLLRGQVDSCHVRLTISTNKRDVKLASPCEMCALYVLVLRGDTSYCQSIATDSVIGTYQVSIDTAWLFAQYPGPCKDSAVKS